MDEHEGLSGAAAKVLGAAIRRLLGAIMLEQNDERAVTRRYLTLETVVTVCEDTTMDPAKIAAL